MSIFSPRNGFGCGGNDKRRRFILLLMAATIAKGGDLIVTDMDVMPCGLIHGRVDSLRIILLPKQSDKEADMHLIYDRLSAIDELDHTHGPMDWVLDLSLVTEMPLCSLLISLPTPMIESKRSPLNAFLGATRDLFATYPLPE